MKKFTGTGVALITPFQKDGTVDVTGLQKLVQHVIDGKVEFLVPLGTTGESVTLDEKESDLVIRTVQQVNTNAGLPVLIGCGGNDTRQILAKQKKYAESYQPDGFLSVTPYYSKPSQEGLYRHFKTLAENTEIDIVLYNVPGRTGINMLPDTVLRLAKECSNIIAIKEASGNIEQGVEILRRKPENFVVLSGDDTLAMPQMTVGYEGCISVAANGYPQIFSDCIRLAARNQNEEARRKFYALFPWMNLLFREGNPAGIKTSLEIQGICGSDVRLPLAEGSAALRALIQEQIVLLNQLV